VRNQVHSSASSVAIVPVAMSRRALAMSFQRSAEREVRAMKHAVIAGREAYLAGRMGKKKYADPTSPLGGLI